MSQYYGERPPYRRAASPFLREQPRSTTLPKSPTAFPGSYDDEEPFYGPTEKTNYPDSHRDEYYESRGYKPSSSPHPRDDEYYRHNSNSSHPYDRRDYQQEYPAERDDDYFRDPRRTEYDFVDRNVEPQEDDFLSSGRRREDERRWDREPHVERFERPVYHQNNESYGYNDGGRQYQYEPRTSSLAGDRSGRPYWDGRRRASFDGERERQRPQYEEYADEAPYSPSRRLQPDIYESPLRQSPRRPYRDADEERRGRQDGGFREAPAPMPDEYFERPEDDYVAQSTRSSRERERDTIRLSPQRERGRSRSPYREGRRAESPHRYHSRSPTRQRARSPANAVRDDMDQRHRERIYSDYWNNVEELTPRDQAYNYPNIPSRDDLRQRKPSLRVEIPTPNGSLPRRSSVERQSPSKTRPHYVIRVPANGPHVSFTPSTEVPSTVESDEVNDEVSGDRTSSSHAERVANAKLLKEQSEARHQILKEVRQAMELRDMASNASDKVFWEQQIETLNNDLRILCNQQEQTKPSSVKPREIHLEASPKTKSDNEFEAIPIENASSTASSSLPAAPTTLKIRAPEALPGGHEFKVQINGTLVKAKVPKGGVKKGDVFLIRLPFDPANKKPNAGPGMVKVRAPASLPEGYRFTAKMGEDRVIVATVPKGGVKKGEIFKVPIVDYKESPQRVSI